MEGFQKYGWPVQIPKLSHFPPGAGTLFDTSFSPKKQTAQECIYT